MAPSVRSRVSDYMLAFGDKIKITFKTKEDDPMLKLCKHNIEQFFRSYADQIKGKLLCIYWDSNADFESIISSLQSVNGAIIPFKELILKG